MVECLVIFRVKIFFKGRKRRKSFEKAVPMVNSKNFLTKIDFPLKLERITIFNIEVIKHTVHKTAL